MEGVLAFVQCLAVQLDGFSVESQRDAYVVIVRPQLIMLSFAFLIESKHFYKGLMCNNVVLRHKFRFFNHIPPYNVQQSRTIFFLTYLNKN